MIYITDKFAGNMFQGLGVGNVLERGINRNVSYINELGDDEVVMCINNAGIQSYLKDKGICVINNQRRIQPNEGDTVLVLKPSGSVIDYRAEGQLPPETVCILEEWKVK